jgi:rfaE bifunctional protein kinase chain/domain
LGARVSLIAAVGNDEAGTELRRKLSGAGVDVDGVIVSDKIQTTTKVRILAGHAHSNKQQVIRIDYDGSSIKDERIVAALKSSVKSADAVIVSDYNYGVVDDDAIALIRESTIRPVLVDSRFHLWKFKGFTAATPNEDEVEHLVGHSIKTIGELELDARTLKEQLEYRALLVTRGARGMMLVEDDTLLHIPAVGAQQSVDVTGAGDTVIATFTLAIASAASFADAAHLANHAGGLVVMKRGTASVTTAELEHSILNSENE